MKYTISYDYHLDSEWPYKAYCQYQLGKFINESSRYNFAEAKQTLLQKLQELATTPICPPDEVIELPGPQLKRER